MKQLFYKYGIGLPAFAVGFTADFMWNNKDCASEWLGNVIMKFLN